MSANNNREGVTPESLRALADKMLAFKPAWYVLAPDSTARMFRAAADEIERIQAVAKAYPVPSAFASAMQAKFAADLDAHDAQWAAQVADPPAAGG
jgi:hypothetical protein